MAQTAGPEPAPVRITVVHSPACHFCEDADSALDVLARDHRIEVTSVPIDSAEGAALVATHRPAMNPLVLVEGRFFSSGRLPRRKLAKLLRDRQQALVVPTAQLRDA
jgi:hypothetical protein